MLFVEMKEVGSRKRGGARWAEWKVRETRPGWNE